MQIDSGEIAIPVRDGDLPAFVARPVGAGPYPVIVIIHEVFGVYGHLDAVGRGWAELGYCVVIPLLFTRQGDVHRLETLAAIHEITKNVSDRQVRDDLDDVFAWLKTQPYADTTRSGITGFCWGGRQVWLYAAHNATVKAGVAWYGGPLSAPPTGMHPSNPIDVVRSLKCPVLGLYGGSDHLLPMPAIEAMAHALEAVASASKIHVYPGARHGFHAPSRGNHDPAATQDGDRRLLDWFRAHHVGG